MPRGMSINDVSKQCFDSVDDAVGLLKDGYYMAKMDLKAAYRSVCIHPQDRAYTGLKWHENGVDIDMYDTKLPFGARKSVEIFHRLSQAVKRFMAKRRHEIIVYIDDFLVVANSRTECQLIADELVSLLRHLGFKSSWKKIIDPTQCITFPGVEIDSVDMCLRVPDCKL